MSSSDVGTARPTETAEVSTIDMGLEVVTVPVSDVERAKRFYQGLGWRLDADFAFDNGFRVVQFTPPGSGCSIAFGRGIIKAEPGSIERLEMAVYNIEATREDLISRGVEVSELFHSFPGEEPGPGPDPQGRSYATYATFEDPDGNGWLLQEIKERLPGR